MTNRFKPGCVYGLQRVRVLCRTPLSVTVNAAGIQTIEVQTEGTQEWIEFRGEKIYSKDEITCL